MTDERKETFIQSCDKDNIIAIAWTEKEDDVTSTGGMVEIADSSSVGVIKALSVMIFKLFAAIEDQGSDTMKDLVSALFVGIINEANGALDAEDEE